MPKRKEPELGPKEQFKRFRDTAKILEVDETGKGFEEAFSQVARPKSPPRGGQPGTAKGRGSR